MRPTRNDGITVIVKPTTKCYSQFVVQYLDPGLQQQVCATLGPAHLLLLDKAFAD
jgi:hypothetical protein